MPGKRILKEKNKQSENQKEINASASTRTPSKSDEEDLAAQQLNAPVFCIGQTWAAQGTVDEQMASPSGALRRIKCYRRLRANRNRGHQLLVVKENLTNGFAVCLLNLVGHYLLNNKLQVICIQSCRSIFLLLQYFFGFLYLS